jgi:hypothetical protein
MVIVKKAIGVLGINEVKNLSAKYLTYNPNKTIIHIRYRDNSTLPGMFPKTLKNISDRFAFFSFLNSACIIHTRQTKGNRAKIGVSHPARSPVFAA